jgi:hypothetical protein
MNNNLSLKRKIMARIYFEYTKNILSEYPDYFMFALFVITSFTLVSVRDVFINFRNTIGSNFFSTFNFAFAALRDTSWIIQILIAGFFARIAFLGIRKTYKNLNIGWIGAKLRYFRY